MNTWRAIFPGFAPRSAVRAPDRTVTATLALCAATVVGACPAHAQNDAGKPPNIILIMADDLGYAEVGCYGQEKIKTPNIDRLAAEGMMFTQFYSGNTVCAPSRCCLLTGKHTGHSFIRDNSEMGGWDRNAKEGQRPLPEGTTTIGTLLQAKGYATCAVGKWGLGGPDSTGQPNKQGFDHWYGYLCQRVAHNYYPTHLWRNGEKHMLEGNEYFAAHQRIDTPPDDPDDYQQYQGAQYAPDLMADEALQFIRQHDEDPFFLYFATIVPHVALQVPDDSLQQYADLWEETPYLGKKGYLPHPSPRAAYAAMITRMDRNVGRIIDLVKELGLEENTLIMFTSDNGPTYAGGVDFDFFNSAGPLRGLKGSLYEGGIRVPFIARWKGRIEPGAKSDHIGASWDVLPTVAEFAGIAPEEDVDGISLVDTLIGNPGQKTHPYMYWEYRARNGNQAVRMGDWKALRRAIRKNPDSPLELYNLGADLGETTDVSAENPEVVAELERIMDEARTESAEFPLRK